jgi:hypothetical protein
MKAAQKFIDFSATKKETHYIFSYNKEQRTINKGIRNVGYIHLH